MKVSEAIKLLESKVVKAEENLKHFHKDSRGYAANEARIIAYNIAINKLEQIDEPQAEKVEVPDFVAEWYEENEGDINQAMYNATIDVYSKRHTTEFEKWFSDSRNDTYGTIARMKDGYTVKPKRWVVKYTSVFSQRYYFIGWDTRYSFLPNGCKLKTAPNVITFTDKSKAEAVATLVEGSVEEV